MSALNALARAGVLECRPGPAGAALRANPRFLAHAEEVAARRGHWRAEPALAAALSDWDEEGRGLHRHAAFVAAFLAEREQLGRLRPAFPALEGFGLAPS
jgi:hypothetical protein